MNNYQLVQTAKGNHTIVFSGKTEIRIHSAYDPVAESRRAADNFSKGRASLLAVSGLGLGYHVDALKKKFPDTEILVIERDREVVTLAMDNYPSHLEGVTVITSDSEINAYFDTFDIGGFRGIAHYIHRPSYQIDSAFYNSLVSRIKENISSRISDMLTRFEFEERWIENIFRNIHTIKDSMPVTGLFGAFSGCPGIIISAGPSLRKNVDLLKNLRNRALLVCVDTAYKVCSRRGIKPHIVMTLDAQRHSVRHFLGVSPEETFLLADVVSCPAILRSYGGPRILSTTSKYFTDACGNTRRETTPVMDWIERHTEPVGDIQSGGSVATSAFDLLLNLGCDPVILIGQDLAYTGREIHSSGTYHNDSWLPSCTRLKNLDTINQAVIRKRSIKRIEAYGGRGTVITDFVLDLYRGWFEDSARRVKLTTINATGGGARLRNTRERDMLSLTADLPERSPVPARIMERAFRTFRKEDAANLEKALHEAISSVERLINFTEKSGQADGFLESAEAMMRELDIDALINPFLRKTRFYIFRHDIEDVRASSIMARDILSASRKLLPLMRSAAGALNEDR